jgi:hypothetical protein
MSFFSIGQQRQEQNQKSDRSLSRSVGTRSTAAHVAKKGNGAKPPAIGPEKGIELNLGDAQVEDEFDARFERY